jgi:hypothetical protein
MLLLSPSVSVYGYRCAMEGSRTEMSGQQAKPPASFARRLVALILDFYTAFILADYLFSWATGNLASDSLSLSGWPAFLFFTAVAAYFYIGWKLAGGTLWDRILGIRRPQPY